MSGLAPPTARRFHRSPLERGPSLAEKLSGEVQRLSYGTILHALQLRERFPSKLLVAPRDPVGGDAEAGEQILAGRFMSGGQSAPIAGFDWRGHAAPLVRDYADSFVWLADLAATGKGRAAAVAADLTRAWLAANAQYNPFGWAPERIGRRMVNWVANSGLLFGGSDLVHRSALLTAMARAGRHLDRAMVAAPDGLPRLFAGTGAIAAGLALPGGESRAARGEALVAQILADFIGADGAAASRAPADQLEILELLYRTGALYTSRGRLQPPVQRAAVEALACAVHGMVLGDGALASFHGASPASPLRVGRVLALSPSARPLPEAGFQRLAAGGTIVVVDAGPPPEQRFSHGCHASTFAFELSDGAERLIVNCGGVRGLWGDRGNDLAAMLRATAAHSTLVLADTNSTRLREDGCLGRGVTEVTAEREEGPDGHLVEAVHDGYARRYGFNHRRRLFLSAAGDDLRGEDELVAQRRHAVAAPFAIRFHLAPGVAAEAGPEAMRLVTPGGAVWRFRARDAEIMIEESVTVSAGGRARRTRQIVVAGTAPAVIAWSLRKLA